MSTPDHWLAALTGVKDAARASGASTKSENYADMLRTLFPDQAGRGKHGINTARAAKSFGVHPSTIRRWATGTQKPSATHEKRLRRRTRQASTTKRGRAAAIKNALKSPITRTKTNRARVAIDGVQGPPTRDPSRGSKDYLRNRTTTVDLSWEDYDKLADAYIQGGTEAAASFFQSKLVEMGYPDDFQIHETNAIGLGTSENRHSFKWF